MTTQLPDDAVYVVSAKLNFNFQGNRMVKVSYDANSKKAFVRYFPAIITYRKRLSLSDLDDLKGDMLIFTKSYMLWKMSQKELQILKAVDLDADNGKVDLTVLKEFSDSMLQKYNELKPEILLYATAN